MFRVIVKLLVLFSKYSFSWRDFYLLLLLLQHLWAVCSSLRFHLRALRLTRAVLAATSGGGVAVRPPAWRTGSSLDGELGVILRVASHNFPPLSAWFCSCIYTPLLAVASMRYLQRCKSGCSSIPDLFSVHFLHASHCFALTGKPLAKRKPVGCTFEDEKP